MPELPEVEVIRNELKSNIINQEIKNIEVYWHKTFVNLCQESPNNQQIFDIDRLGKYIIFILEKDFLIVHLRMTGQLIFNKNNNYSKNHLRASILMHSGDNLNFYDARKFGRIYYVDDLKSFFTKVGIDALSQEFTNKYFEELLSNKNCGIKSFLLDQKYIAGLGNIYIDESLFISGIHPKKLTSEINHKKTQLLFTNIKKILNSAIANMGTTISDYRTSGGGFGTNQNLLKVYGREGNACFKCGSGIKKIRINSRGTHYCPVCQPENGVLQ